MKAFMPEISPAGIGRFPVRFIKASCLYSCTWFKTDAPADRKKIPKNRKTSDASGLLPDIKYPVSAEKVTMTESRTLTSLLKIEKTVLYLLCITGSFEIIYNFIQIFS